MVVIFQKISPQILNRLSQLFILPIYQPHYPHYCQPQNCQSSVGINCRKILQVFRVSAGGSYRRARSVSSGLRKTHFSEWLDLLGGSHRGFRSQVRKREFKCALEYVRSSPINFMLDRSFMPSDWARSTGTIEATKIRSLSFTRK